MYDSMRRSGSRIFQKLSSEIIDASVSWYLYQQLDICSTTCDGTFMHVSAASPGVRPPGTPGDLSKTPNKAYLIPWGMEQEKVTKFPHPRVPKEVRERTVHV